jgi:hypothetical protein
MYTARGCPRFCSRCCLTAMFQSALPYCYRHTLYSPVICVRFQPCQTWNFPLMPRIESSPLFPFAALSDAILCYASCHVLHSITITTAMTTATSLSFPSNGLRFPSDQPQVWRSSSILNVSRVLPSAFACQSPPTGSQSSHGYGLHTPYISKHSDIRAMS